MPKAIDLTGQVFGRLTAVEPTGESKHSSRVWQCQCACGKEVTVTVRSLRAGTTRSCGCLASETDAVNGRKAKIAMPFSVARLEQLYKDGTPITSLALQAGVSKNTITRWLLAENIEIRGRSQVARLTALRYRSQNINKLQSAREKAVQMRREGFIKPYPRSRKTKARVAASLRHYFTTSNAKQQAEREQSEAIERALNGDTFK